MALMTIGTTLMAVTPSYATTGLAAPIVITIARRLAERQHGTAEALGQVREQATSAAEVPVGAHASPKRAPLW